MKLLPPKRTFYKGGHIYWDGTDILPWPEEKLNTLRGSDMAMVFQDPMTALNPVLTIGDQITEGIRSNERVTKKAAYQRALSLLADTGITSPEKRLHQYPHELSGGMRQRCLIAMALACSPRLLFADEPTTALDVTTEAQVLQMLRHLQERRNMAIVLISHNLGVIAQMCQRVYVMYAGTVVEEGSVESIFTGQSILIRKDFWHRFPIQIIRIGPLSEYLGRHPICFICLADAVFVPVALKPCIFA